MATALTEEDRSSKTELPTLPAAKSFALLTAFRLARRWNQTGQKLAGEADIARTYFSSHKTPLWTAVITTYLVVAQSLFRKGLRHAPYEWASSITITISLAAFGFKAAYTYVDAPELLRGFPQPILNGLMRASLLTQARAVFLGLVLVLFYGLFLNWKAARVEKQKGNRSEFILSWASSYGANVTPK